MGRPKWGAVDPNTGEVYFILANNPLRTGEQVDAANPNAESRKPEGLIRKAFGVCGFFV